MQHLRMVARHEILKYKNHQYLPVRGRTVVISVEPVPDDASAPFAIKPLLATAGQDTAPSSHSFTQNLGSLPTGTVSR